MERSVASMENIYPTAYPTFFNSTAFTDLSTTCSQANATNPCPEGCAEALMTIRDNIGCCFNNYYNVSGSEFLQFASNQLWTACQVATLGRCTQILNPNASGTTMMPTTMMPSSMMPTTAGGDAIAAGLVNLLILVATNVFVFWVVRIFTTEQVPTNQLNVISNFNFLFCLDWMYKMIFASCYINGGYHNYTEVYW